MSTPDPVDVRLLSVIAESGRMAVHEIAGRLGLDIREVAARLAALSTTGLPIVVGVECDPRGVRSALAAAGVFAPAQAPPVTHQGQHSHPSQPFGAVNPGQAANNAQGPASQGHSGQGSLGTFGPPGSANWAARNESSQQGNAGFGQQNAAQAAPSAQQQAPVRHGTIGAKLDVEGPEGQALRIQLVEIVDPADFLFTAAGHQLGENQRAVVVHTEIQNLGATPFAAVADQHLFLVTREGASISKSSVTLSSRPPHSAGVPGGQTAGGHTVYVLPDSTELAAVRWSARLGDEQRTLTWTLP